MASNSGQFTILDELEQFHGKQVPPTEWQPETMGQGPIGAGGGGEENAKVEEGDQKEGKQEEKDMSVPSNKTTEKIEKNEPNEQNPDEGQEDHEEEQENKDLVHGMQEH